MDRMLDVVALEDLRDPCVDFSRGAVRTGRQVHEVQHVEQAVWRRGECLQVVGDVADGGLPRGTGVPGNERDHIRWKSEGLQEDCPIDRVAQRYLERRGIS